MTTEMRERIAEFEQQHWDELYGYSLPELVRTREDSVRRDLAEGDDYVCCKVPSYYEVMVPADLARAILAG